ncbi:hypothetical protein [Terriglobus albidus]|uniref:hypothetical protein n=1 Tax=Terriglobus albidus TaxID=1592106 RepID=UPI0021E008D9|nr:hypothetical protein [Terriglobus albidus]
MIRSLAKTVVVFFLTPAVFAGEKPKSLKSYFCVPASPSEWKLQGYPPLINPKAGTTYAEIWASGTMVERVKWRRFQRNRDVMFEYHYDTAGNLKSLQASLHYWGYWVAEAELTLDGEAEKGLTTVHYYKARAVTGEQMRAPMNNPEEKGRYLDELNAATRWMTTQAVPCADKLS